jgi:hypothetical protein
MMAGRIDAFYEKRPDLKEFAPEGIIGELRRLNYDTANATSPPDDGGFDQARARVSNHLRYGLSLFRLGSFKSLEEAGLSAADLESIGSGNATRLIPRP